MFDYAFKCKSNRQKPDPKIEDSVEEVKFFEGEEFENLALRFEQLKEIIEDSQKK
ncbi:MAG: hypothetical protein V5A72_00700 [Candidatus Nanohaloarchaea archaeon]